MVLDPLNFGKYVIACECSHKQLITPSAFVVRDTMCVWRVIVVLLYSLRLFAVSSFPALMHCTIIRLFSNSPFIQSKSSSRNRVSIIYHQPALDHNPVRSRQRYLDSLRGISVDQHLIRPLLLLRTFTQSMSRNCCCVVYESIDDMNHMTKHINT